MSVAAAEVIREMNKARDSYPCDAISVTAATAAIARGVQGIQKVVRMVEIISADELKSIQGK